METDLLIVIVCFAIFIAISLGLSIWGVIASQNALQEIQNNKNDLKELSNSITFSFPNQIVSRIEDSVEVATTNLEFKFGSLGQCNFSMSSFEVNSGLSTAYLVINFDFSQLPSNFKSFNTPISIICKGVIAPGDLLFNIKNNQIILETQKSFETTNSVLTNENFELNYGVPDTFVSFVL